MISDTEFKDLQQRVIALEKHLENINKILGTSQRHSEQREQMKKDNEKSHVVLRNIMLPIKEVEEVINGKKNYTIIFSRRGCGSCVRFNVQMVSIIDTLDLARIRYVDVNDTNYRTLKNHFRIVGTPTVMQITDGKTTNSATGNTAINLLPKKI